MPEDMYTDVRRVVMNGGGTDGDRLSSAEQRVDHD